MPGTGQAAESSCFLLPSSAYRKGTRHFLVSAGLRVPSSPTKKFWADPCMDVTLTEGLEFWPPFA